MALERREIFFETLQIGDLLRLGAIDSASGIEVVVVGPVNAARHDLERLALRKLERALADAGQIAPDMPAVPKDTTQATRRGKLV